MMLANIYQINKKEVKLFTSKQATIQKLEYFFINQKDLHAEEVEELYHTLLMIYSNKEVVTILGKALGLDEEALK